MNHNMYDALDIGQNGQVVRNRVLRNTYWLLALSMIPTVIGAIIGVTMRLPMLTGGIGALIFLGIVYGFIYAIEANKESGLGVGLLLAFTFFMGMMLTPLLMYTLRFSNGGQLIMLAVGGTAGVFAAMASYATVTKRDFSGIGAYLGMAMLVIIISSLVNIFFLHMEMMSLVICAFVMVISSALLIYRVQQVVNGGETNYVSATLGIYISLFNIFTSLLRLLSLGGRD